MAQKGKAPGLSLTQTDSAVAGRRHVDACPIGVWRLGFCRFRDRRNAIDHARQEEFTVRVGLSIEIRGVELDLSYGVFLVFLIWATPHCGCPRAGPAGPAGPIASFIQPFSSTATRPRTQKGQRRGRDTPKERQRDCQRGDRETRRRVLAL